MQTKQNLPENAVFIENFKKLYSQQSIETILNDFADCYLEVSKYESLELDREELLNLLITKEVYNA
jgi:hypothetical protein